MLGGGGGGCTEETRRARTRGRRVRGGVASSSDAGSTGAGRRRAELRRRVDGCTEESRRAPTRGRGRPAGRAKRPAAVGAASRATLSMHRRSAATWEPPAATSLALARPSTLEGVERSVVIEAIGLSLAVCTCACGTTVIAPQPGHEWCVEVQGPRGSVSDPESFDQSIVDPDTGMDPRGCLCFSTADDHTLDAGLEAEQSGAPLPAGYEDLREQIVAAARLRCTEAALASEPPLMYTDCLSADVSLPYRPPTAPTAPSASKPTCGAAASRRSIARRGSRTPPRTVLARASQRRPMATHPRMRPVRATAREPACSGSSSGEPSCDGEPMPVLLGSPPACAVASMR